MVNIWNLLTNTQLKEATSKDLFALGSNQFLDFNAQPALKQIDTMKKYTSFMKADGLGILQDGLFVKTFSVNDSSATVKPSNIFDSSTDPDADKYTCAIIAASATASDSGFRLEGKWKDSVAIMRQQSWSASGQEPLQLYYAGEALYFNDDYPIVFTASGSIAGTVEVAVVIVARGGI